MTNYGNEPNLTLSDLYDKDVVYTSRPSYISNPWLKPDEHQSNFLTGRELLIANQLPVIVHEASATDKLHQLFQVIGKDVPNSIYTFNNQQYYALDKTLFVALNNKARIPEWTNGKFLPKRKVVKIEQFENEIKNWEFPFVIKPGDDLPTAGGYGVMICYHDADLQKAITRIKEATAETNSLIIEQKIEEKANYCVQFAYSESLGIQYLGAATQLTDKYGFYNGNENTTNVPEHVIEAGRQIMENGVNQGFFGVAGFDLLVDEDDNVYAIDLNFRQNGSTSMLLLANELNSGYQKFYSYHSKGDNTHFFNTILKYVKEGSLYPLSYYDGDWYIEDEVKSRFGCIWHGDSKETVLENERAFLAELERC
ncbi:TPA: ATP-grasp domain-containing protein [Staphylococcus aureus]|nr:ATP-grasp domain-containing protein [Staphylococcus aureus]HCZ9420773.1 ATP-grasp domain-containing protein [Staphylococcus aureus]HDH1015011.1 ATP-grasp domain-containing protein [Staphylococcus aureus]HDS2043903.1 ATP-grasp domain-containing protein [Staphylococcus aureus]HEI7734066.1 ATP-grasp domain-containing protein [Staphylococcus aureus]